MKIEKALESDLPKIMLIIGKEFPYVERSLEKTINAIKEEKITIFKAVEGNKFIGFIEAQFLEEGIARINGVSVEEDSRGQGIGKTLLQYTIKFLKEKGIERILLLVKQSNEKAKSLYREMGFGFIGLYHRKLDNEIIEEMELDLGNRDKPAYVS